MENNINKEFLPTKSNDDTYVLQLILTTECNLHCRYCYVHPSVRGVMPLNIAKNAIKKAISECDRIGIPLKITFMGGEPLSAFSTMREICEWTWSTWPERDIQFHSPTNGTLLTSEMRSWLEANSTKISLALSYDGTRSQYENRTPNKIKIDEEFFLRLWPWQYWKVTISEQNVTHLADDIIYLQKRGILFSANCAFGEKRWSTQSIGEYGRQMLLLAQYYSENPELPLPDLLQINFASVFFSRIPMQKRCGLGQNYVTVDCVGREFPCHLMSSLTLEEAQIKNISNYQFSTRQDFTVPLCEGCVLNQTCPKCYGMSLINCGTPFCIDQNACSLFRQQTRAACSYQIKRIYALHGQMTENDTLILSAIYEILRHKSELFDNVLID